MMKEIMKSIAIMLAVVSILYSCSSNKQEYINTINQTKSEIPDQGVTAEWMNKMLDAYDVFISKFPQDSLVPIYMYEKANVYKAREDFEKCIELLDEIQVNFPESSAAANSLFLKGFIMENDLKQLDEAQKLYTAFLNKYPSHALAESARVSIQLLGKPLEEIVKEFEQKKNSNAEL